MAGLNLSKRTMSIIAGGVVIVLGTVGVVSAMGDDGSPTVASKRSTQSQQSTTTAEEHDMDHGGSDHNHGGSTGSTSGDHDMEHDGHDHGESTGSTSGDHDMEHDGGHDHTGSNGSTGTTHGGHDHTGSNGSTGTTHGGHDHTATTGGSTATTHGGHDHTGTTTSGSGGTTTTHGGHNHGSSTTGTGGGGTTTTHNHHGGPVVQYSDLPADVQALVDLGTNVALKYPTTADASAHGWAESTIYFPGIAAHYLRAGWLDGNFDPAKPEVLLYGSQGQLVGINYIVYNGATPPEGFPGSYDSWHEHPALCRSLTTGLIIGGETLTDQECANIGGVMFSFAGFWLLHVWTVPGWDSPEGIFSHENSRV